MMFSKWTDSCPFGRHRVGLRARSAALLAAALVAAPIAALADSVDVVRLSTGESLRVQILSVDADLVTFNHPALGTMTVPRAAVVEIVRGVAPDAVPDAPPVDAVPPAAPPAPAPEPVAAAEVPAADEPDPQRWQFRLTFAGGGSAGNTENINFLIRFRAKRETDDTRFRFVTSYFYASTDGDKSDNRFNANARHDWLLPESRWFIFAQGAYDYDEFQSWLHRVQGFGGAGYRIVEPPRFALDGLVGLGATKEWKSDNDSVRMEGLIGLEGALEIAQNHTFGFATTLFPDLTDFGEFRWTNSVAWAWRFNTRMPLSLSAGLEHEYQSEVNPGRDRNDLRVFAGVDWDF